MWKHPYAIISSAYLEKQNLQWNHSIVESKMAKELGIKRKLLRVL